MRTLQVFTSLIVTAVLFALLPAAGQAQTPTQVLVRAVSQDAKILQDPVGGAHIVIRDVETGEVLAEGRQTGRSGSTDTIMHQPRVRGAMVYDTPEAAHFLATLMLDRPTQVEISAEGPLGYPQAVQRTSKTMLLVPGQDVLGEGVLLTIHGFIVELLEPSTPAAAPGETLHLRARVRMTCGCPTEPGGLWDSDTMTILARLVTEDAAVVAETPLTFAGETSIYEGSLTVPEGDGYTIEVLAMDADRANFGHVRQELQLASGH